MKHAAITLIFNSGRNEILLIKRRDIPIWVLPGGGIDEGETAEMAAIREAFEETGLHVKIIRKTGEYTPINRLASLTHVFECRVENGSLETGEETEDIGFFKVNELPKAFFFLHQGFLEDALNHAEMVRKPLDQVTYWNLLMHFFKHPMRVIYALIARLRG